MRPSFSIACRSFWLIILVSEAVIASPYRTQVRPSRSLGSFEPFAWMMKVRRIPRAPPKRPASNTTLSRGEACRDPVRGDAEGLVVVQSSRANTNAAKSTSCTSSRRRSNVVVPGLKDVVQGSTCATPSRPRVSACSSFSCFPDEPRKMRGLSMRSHLIGESWSPTCLEGGRRSAFAAGPQTLERNTGFPENRRL